LWDSVISARVALCFGGRRTMRGLHTYHINSGKQMSTSVAIDFSFAKVTHTTHTQHPHTHRRPKKEEHKVRGCIMKNIPIPVCSSNNNLGEPFFQYACMSVRVCALMSLILPLIVPFFFVAAYYSHNY